MMTTGRVCHFDEIQSGKMILNEFDKIAESKWPKSFELRRDLLFDAFVIAQIVLNQPVNTNFFSGRFFHMQNFFYFDSG